MRIKNAIYYFVLSPMRRAAPNTQHFHPFGRSPASSIARFSVALMCVALVSGCASRAALPSASAAASDAPRVRAGHAATESPADLLPEVGGERIAAIHRSKCGSCHTPVEPGSLQRDDAAAAMQRHRRRARLSERDWADMVEFLSADGTLHARHTARVP
jgi:hypothetical protein